MRALPLGMSLVLLLTGCGADIPWQPLFHSDPEGARYASAGPVDADALRSRFALAVALLNVDPETARLADIYVWSRPTWWDGRRTVAGTIDDTTAPGTRRLLTVGSDLASVAHELAHLRDYEAGRWWETEAAAHARWGVDGTRAALDQFDSLFFGGIP